MYGGMPVIRMKKGERVRWYLLALGNTPNFHTPHWHGNGVLFDGHRVDTVALSPAQSITVDMIPDNPGIWLFSLPCDSPQNHLRRNFKSNRANKHTTARAES